MGLQTSTAQPDSANSGMGPGSHILSDDLERAASAEGGTYIQPPAAQRITQPASKSPKKDGKAAESVVLDAFPRLVPAQGVSPADAVTAVVAGLDANARPLKEADYAHFCEGVQAAHAPHPEAPKPAAGGSAARNRNVRAQGGLQQPSGSSNNH